MDDSTKKDTQDLIVKTLDKYDIGPGFTSRKLTDTPTDALSVINKKYADGNVLTLTDGPTVDINVTGGNIFYLLATASRTINAPTGNGTRKMIIQFEASGGDWLLSLTGGNGGFRFGVTVSGLTATLDGTTDYVGCLFNVPHNVWDVVAVSKGY